MKRWLLWIGLAIVAAAWAIAVRQVMRAEARKGREANYQSALQNYSQVLNVGLSRKDVEAYLRLHEVKFMQAPIEEHGAIADLVKVGQEDAPWRCGQSIVYVAFEFTATDALKGVRIFRHLEGCL